jgi:hypothetical protein
MTIQAVDTDNSYEHLLNAIHSSLVSAAIPSWMLEVADSYATYEKCLKYLQELAIDKNNHPTITL